MNIVPFPKDNQHSNTSSFLGVDLNSREKVAISDLARTNGWSLTGGTGSGKTTLMINTFVQDAGRGHGCVYITPDADAISDITARLPTNALSRTILLDAGDPEHHIGLNQLYSPDPADPNTVERLLDRQLHIFKKIWGQEEGDASWGPQLEDILSYCLLTLIYNRLTLAEIPLLLRDEEYRRNCVQYIRDFRKLN